MGYLCTVHSYDFEFNSATRVACILKYNKDQMVMVCMTMAWYGEPLEKLSQWDKISTSISQPVNLSHFVLDITSNIAFFQFH